MSYTVNRAFNYYLDSDASAAAHILPKPVDIVAVPDIKVYDGTTSTDKIPIEVPDLILPDYGIFYLEYDDKYIGIGKTLIPHGVIYDGNNGANYILTYVVNNEGEIEQALGIKEVPELVNLVVK